MAFRSPPSPFYFLICEHPYVEEGSKLPTAFTDEEKGEAFYKIVRVDLPGVCEETVKVWAGKEVINFEGEEGKNDEEFDIESPRKFKGQFPLFDDEGPFKTDEIKYVVKDGVLKVLIPKQQQKGSLV